MPLFTFGQLFTPITRDEAIETMLDVAESAGVPLRSWQKFGIGRTLLVLVAQVVANLDIVREEMARSGFLTFAAHTDGTTNPWLDALALGVYGVERPGATFATTTLTLTNSSGVPIVVPVNTHFGKTDGGATYASDVQVVAPAAGSVSCAITADESGSASNAAPGDITVIVNPIPFLTASNPTPAVGRDQATDLELVELCNDKLASLSPNGARGAYSYLARTATDADGVNLGVTRVRVVSDPDAGTVLVYLADADGPVTEPVRVAVDARLQALAVPDCVGSATLSAVAHDVLVQCVVYAVAPVPTADQLLDALIAHFAEQPIGGVELGGPPSILSREAIGGALHTAYPSVRSVTFSSPTGNVTLSLPEVATLISVAGNITVVPV